MHIFSYRLKCLLRDRMNVFWTLCFPLILATFFNLAFGSLMDEEKFEPVPLAVVQNDTYDNNLSFKTVLEEVSTGEDRLFDLQVVNLDKADKLLKDGEISAYIVVGGEIELIIRKTGINQSIVKAFLDQYQQTFIATSDIFTNNPEAYEKIIAQIGNPSSYIKEVPISKSEPNTVLNYFYSLIAMACMYGSFWGLREITDIQANLSSRAARINLSPTHKLKTFIINISAATLIQFVEILVLIAYLKYFIKIDFGDKTGFVILTSFVGTVTGITLGAFISALVNTGEGVKIAISLAVSMVGSFFAGMMFDKMKYIVSQKAPIISYINPVNLLADALYSLYYYDGYSRYWLDIGLLCAFIAVFSLGTFLVLRRRKYASI